MAKRKAIEMKSYLFVMLIAGITLGNVDILIPETGQAPIMGWTDNNMPWLMYCQEPLQPVFLGNSCQEIFLSLHTESDSEPVLMAVLGSDGWNESVEFRTIDLWDHSMSIYQELSAYEFFPPVFCSWFSLPILPRYSVSGEDRKMFIVMNTGYTDGSVQNETWMTTVPVDPWSPSLVNPVDTTSWRQGFFSSECFLSEQVPQGSLPPFTTASGSWDGYPGPSFIGIYIIYLESDTLHENTLYGISGNYPEIDPEVLAIGYSQTDQIALWTDTAGAVWCSNFISSPVNPATSALEIAHSEQPFAAALTKTREDAGILLAWYDGSNIMVRHWQGEWNGYAHIVEPWTHVSPDNIAVCSDTDGYWVAWKDDLEMMPQYRFIQRNIVTGIDHTNAGLSNEVLLTISENPVSSATTFSVTLPLNERYSLCLFDLYGRDLGELASGEGGQFEGLLDLSGYPSGIYNVVLSTEQGICSTRVLKTGN